MKKQFFQQIVISVLLSFCLIGCSKGDAGNQQILESCIEDIYNLQTAESRYESATVIAYRGGNEIPVSSMELWTDHEDSLMIASNSPDFRSCILTYNGSTFMKNIWSGIDLPEESWAEVPDMNLTPSGIAGQALNSANCVFLSTESTPASRTVVFSQNDVNPVIEWHVSYDSEGNIVQIELSSSMELLDENGKVVPTPVVNFMEFEIGNSIIRDTILKEYTLAVEESADNNTSVFPFTLPDGFRLVDESIRECVIEDINSTRIGGIILTELKPSDLNDDGNALPLYIYAIDETSEYMSWIGEDPEHPICYMSQYVTDEETSTQRMYYRVFFEENDVVYDMWFDTSVIDKTTISSFFYIAEQSSFDVQDTEPSEFESSTFSQIKEAVGFPFRLWNSQNQQLHCISIFDSYAKREVDKKTESGYEKYDNLKWSITENTLSITGSWNEDFVIDMTTKTAVSMLDGMVYDIVPGKMLDGQYVE